MMHVLLLLCIPVLCSSNLQSTEAPTQQPIPNGSCPLLAVCKAYPQCTSCLADILPYAAQQNSNNAIIANEVNFWHALQNSPSCNATNPSAIMTALLDQTLNEINFYSDIFNQQCSDYLGVEISPCQNALFECFIDPHCRLCLSDIFDARPLRSAYILQSSSCINVNNSLLEAIAFGPSPFANAECLSFPTCTHSKLQCATDSHCSKCYGQILQGNVWSSTIDCINGSSSTLLDNLVHWCDIDAEIACMYWQARCEQIGICGSCLAEIQYGRSSAAIVHGSSQAPCRKTFESKAAFTQITRYFFFCPVSVVSGCNSEVFSCIAQSTFCLQCLNGSAGPDNIDACDSALDDIVDACQPCSSSVSKINSIILTTVIMGIISIPASLLVIISILAYERDRSSMRDRIIIGVMVASLIFSSANIAGDYLSTETETCGTQLRLFETVRFWRGWYFFGFICLYGFEFLIVGVSLWILRSDSTHIVVRTEMALYCLIFTTGLIGLIVFNTIATRIEDDGYNSQTQLKSLNDPVNHLSLNDDFDDQFPTDYEGDIFKHSRQDYDFLVSTYSKFLLAFFGMQLLLYIWLHVSVRRLMQHWNSEIQTTIKSEEQDAWAETRREQWNLWRAHLYLRKSAHEEIIKELQPYFFTIALFSIVNVIQSSEYCISSSGAIVSTFGNTASSQPSLAYGDCNVVCELILSLRTLAFVAVYFLARERRLEVWHFGTMLRGLLNRTFRVVRKVNGCTIKFYSQQKRNRPLKQLSQIEIEIEEQWQIDPRELKFGKQLAEGAFGIVWDGVWNEQRVAIKVLKAVQVDEDGDPVDFGAEEDFDKECDALKRIDHPHLLKFYGVGVTDSGAGFIVTELLALGSLRGVLQNLKYELKWKSRVSIAYQLALGMEHLHSIPMMHRDLKSANALLDENLNAKVADFGTSRHFRPARPAILYNPFNGKRRLADPVDGVSVANDDVVKVAGEVGIVDLRGTMTKAVGTPLWMAPEIYRGDHNYGPAVDTYSFGIILWEIATRLTPWDELGTELSFFEFFDAMIEALQTGRRPTIPIDIRLGYPEFVDLMERCWKGDPADRPVFSVIVLNLRIYMRNFKSPLQSYVNTGPEDLQEPLLDETNLE